MNNAADRSLPVWQCRYRVRYGEANRYGTLKLRALADYLQEAAADHADNLGVGLGHLAGENMFWVLSRMGVEFERLPRLNEEIKLETWPRHGVSPLFAMREFVLRGADDEVVIRATSAWLLLDAVTLRPRRVSSLPVILPQNLERMFLFEKLDEVADTPCMPFFRERVRESKIDVNRHLNNAEYFSWLEDCAAEAGRRIAFLKRVSINFVSEVKCGEEVEVSMRNDVENAILAVDGIRNSDGRKIFKSTMEFGGES